MRLICVLAGFFALLYLCIGAHYLGYDRASKEAQLNLIQKSVKDAQISTNFISKEYGKFVYAE
ncbi:hypothetical protein CSHOW_0028 [Campylobacter showae]|uniref:Uncharacterized protein n=1 Tax=Campylobacter showae RM3277 TaxID=553219 RepID=C6RJ53_9BACT|nr:hypothetical protein [Campylobacter showae]EET78634.1 hypothetical protein CAMSH0001_0150 [Campylobacter showae RM3277]QCD48024.1 hypothetical protein CSHOW_0028 [Campylobacter showae]